METALVVDAEGGEKGSTHVVITGSPTAVTTMPPDASALESVDGFEIMPVPRPEAIREASVELGAATSTIHAYTGGLDRNCDI